MADPQRGTAGTPAWFGLWGDDGALAPAATLAGLPLDETGAAELIMAERPRLQHHVPLNASQGLWYIWDGRCQRPDDSAAIGRLVIDYARRSCELISWAKGEQVKAARARAVLDNPEATETALRKAGEQAAEPWKAAESFHRKLRTSNGQGALIKVLERLAGISAADMDERNPGLLNLANGTYDLRTGLMKPHSPLDMITYCLDAGYNPAATCPEFYQLLWRVCGENANVAHFVLKLLGYALLGENPEQQIYFLCGPTASGKTVLLDVVSAVAGKLAHNSPDALITMQRQGRNARVENSIRGRRLITITEASARMVIDEGQVKRLTGESRISINEHYAKTEAEVPVTWTIVVATNEMPTLTSYDDAMKRRVVVVPMGQTVPEHMRDKALAGRMIENEAEGILAALIWGWHAYQREGLTPPQEVIQETAKYAAEQNTVANFVADCLMLIPAHMNGGGVPAHILMPDAWQTYQAYSQGGTRLLKGEFFRELARQPGISLNESSRRFEGVTLNPAWMTRMVHDGS